MFLTLWQIFQAVDLHLLNLINREWASTWLDPFLARVSDFDSWRVPLYALVIYLLWRGGFQGRWLVFLMMLCLVIGDASINWAFKILVHRPRPMESISHLRVVTVQGVTESRPHATREGRSFTSGHACNNVALAFVATALFGRAALWLWPWALVVSYSRIYCASHYPSDILGSWLAALAYTYFILKVTAWWWRRYGPVYFPRHYAGHPQLFPGLPFAWARSVSVPK